jgi:hypothetical protein
MKFESEGWKIHGTNLSHNTRSFGNQLIYFSWKNEILISLDLLDNDKEKFNFKQCYLIMISSFISVDREQISVSL